MAPTRVERIRSVQTRVGPTAPARVASARPASRPERGGGRADAAAATPITILAAARVEFAARGLAGARVNLIAARAGVNKQLIYYYFGSKAALYRAALDAVYTEIRERERDLKLGDLAPVDAMAALIGFSFDYLARHPDFIGMLNHENAHGAQYVRTSAALPSANSPLTELVRSTLKRGVAAGVFRRGIDPVALYISFAGMSYFFFSNRLTLSAAFVRDLSSPRVEAAYRKHIIALSLAGLRP